MSRHVVKLKEDRQLVFGWDPPKDLTILGVTTAPIPLEGTFYAQLWDPKHDPDFEYGSPVWALGYHPAERLEPLAADYGPHPIRTLSEFIEELHARGIGPLARIEIDRILSQEGKAI